MAQILSRLTELHPIFGGIIRLLIPTSTGTGPSMLMVLCMGECAELAEWCDGGDMVLGVRCRVWCCVWWYDVQCWGMV